MLHFKVCIQFFTSLGKWASIWEFTVSSWLYIRGFTKFGIKVAWRLQFLEYLRTLSLKFPKSRTKIEVLLALPCWLSQLNWESQQGRARTTSILLVAFWNFRLKVLKYPRNCRHNTLIPWSLKNPELPIVYTYFGNWVPRMRVYPWVPVSIPISIHITSGIMMRSTGTFSTVCG